jgi:hypothetical protein
MIRFGLVQITGSTLLQARHMLQVPSRKLTIGYWACRGLGAPLRMMAAYSQTDYDDKFYEVGESLRIF